MSNRLYVGNLPYTITQNDLQQIFSEFGTVVSTQIISDRETGRSRGFGFVEMDSADAFRKALEGANGRDVGGRQLSVTEARERAPREGGSRPGGPPRSGGGWGGGERRGPPRPGGPPRSGGGGFGSDRGGGGGGGGDDRGWKRDDGSRKKGGGRDRFEKRREPGESAERPRRQRFDSFPEDEDFA